MHNPMQSIVHMDDSWVPTHGTPIGRPMETDV